MHKSAGDGDEDGSGDSAYADAMYGVVPAFTPGYFSCFFIYFIFKRFSARPRKLLNRVHFGQSVKRKWRNAKCEKGKKAEHSNNSNNSNQKGTIAKLAGNAVDHCAWVSLPEVEATKNQNQKRGKQKKWNQKRLKNCEILNALAVGANAIADKQAAYLAGSWTSSKPLSLLPSLPSCSSDLAGRVPL